MIKDDLIQFTWCTVWRTIVVLVRIRQSQCVRVKSLGRLLIRSIRAICCSRIPNALSLTEYLYPFNEHWSNNHKTAVEIFCNTNYRSLKSWVSLSISEPVTLTEDVELKQEIVMMSPPASESGSGSPSQFSPYCVDSEPGSPLLDHEQVNAQRQDHTHSSCPFSVFCRGWWSSTMFVSTWIRVVNRLIKSVLM